MVSDLLRNIQNGDEPGDSTRARALSTPRLENFGGGFGEWCLEAGRKAIPAENRIGRINMHAGQDAPNVAAGKGREYGGDTW